MKKQLVRVIISLELDYNYESYCKIRGDFYNSNFSLYSYSEKEEDNGDKVDLFAEKEQSHYTSNHFN